MHTAADIETRQQKTGSSKEPRQQNTGGPVDRTSLDCLCLKHPPTPRILTLCSP